MQHHPDPAIAQGDFNRICSMIGQPTVLGAAQFSSLAHRVRNFWTNLSSPAQLAAAAAQAKRPSNRTVSLVLGPGRHAQPVKAAASQLLQNGTVPEGTAAEKSRVNKRLQYYTWKQDKVWRRMPDGTLREVPPPANRLALIKQTHSRTGHFGIRRTTAMLLNTWWWHGLQADVAAVVSACKECSRVDATFNAKPAELQPLPIKGLMYRWGVDLAGPFPKTPRGHNYLFIAVEHFSKHIVAVPIAEKTPECTSYVFLHNVLSKYGAMAECCHDRKGEWSGAFEQLLLEAKVDTRSTSANHPAANGAAEKAVHIVKRALEKTCMHKQNVRDWDLEVPWLLLGYNCSPQRNTGFSPYQMLFVHAPVIPPAVTERMQEPIDLDSPSAAATSLLQRKELVSRICPEAMSNLQITQHRDTMRYTQIRSGTYEPKHAKFEAGTCSAWNLLSLQYQLATGCALGTTLPNDRASARPTATH
uniref:Integrase catalytic domain-containing protein n=1 Tax=Tetradesmus obliquus TaxID=3088 RepID=A0A383VGW5_TETOB